MRGSRNKMGRVPEIPDRVYFQIGDVSEIVGVEAHVLRFWETKFPTLSPRKTAKGRRQYKRKDVEMLLVIKHLLYEEQYTIAGARKALHTRGWRSHLSGRSKSSASSESLREIRAELKQILALLDA